MKKKKVRKNSPLHFIIYVTFALIWFSSCKILRPNLMLNTPNDYKYAQLNDSLAKQNYILMPNDVLKYQVYTNDGFRLIDILNTSAAIINEAEVTIESDGTIKMPMIGRIKIQGMTTKETEKKLEDLYSEFYVKPFVKLRVDNKRVIVFPGNGAMAKVIPLTNINTTVIEAIALAGGITEDGKAYKIKLIRTTADGKSLVYLLDLSTINGLAMGQTNVMANDIIYIEPRYKPLQAFVKDIAPIVSLLMSTLILMRVYKSF